MTDLALSVHDLRASIGDLEILKGIDLEVPYGQLHALMGPNGSGKSTLCHVLMGKPGYVATGSALVDGVEMLGMPIDERARTGLFEAFQYPVEIPGVTLQELLDEVAADTGGNGAAARTSRAIADMAMGPFLDRPVNQDLSGGEKKRSEMLQLLALDPRAAVVDEIDSGLDIDAVRDVAAAVEAIRGPLLGVLVITHYSRILRYLTVDAVHVLMAGRIVRSGGPELADELEAKGYEGFRAELGVESPASEPDDFMAGL